MALTDISFSQLRCFVVVVDAGSLAEAGRQLGMSTASVSKALARLEQAAGVKLLHRSTHAISLTRDGEHLIEPAREVVQAASAFSRVAGSQTQESGVGRVRPEQPSDLAAHRLIGFRNQRTGQVRPWSFRQPGKGNVVQVVPDAAYIFDDGASAWKAGVHGGGIVSAPLWLAADDLRAGRAVELLREWRDADMTMYLLRRERRLTPQRVNTVIAYLRQHAPPLVDLA